jgi:hypothetical protein
MLITNISTEAKAVIEAVHHLANKARRDITTNNASPTRMVVTFWFAKAAKSFDAACLLWERGYWQDAVTVARTILELDYQAQYFKKDPASFAQQFFAHAENQLHDLYRKFYGYAEDAVKSEIGEYFERLGVKIEQVRKWKNWWGETSTLSDLVGHLDARQTDVSQYQTLSFIVHGSPAAFRFYIYEHDDTRMLVDSTGQAPNPRVQGLAEMMFVNSALYLLHLITALAEVWPLDYGADLKNAVDSVGRWTDLLT